MRRRFVIVEGGYFFPGEGLFLPSPITGRASWTDSPVPRSHDDLQSTTDSGCGGHQALLSHEELGRLSPAQREEMARKRLHWAAEKCALDNRSNRERGM